MSPIDEAQGPHDAAREIVSSRILHANCEAVFRAFADPAVLARWWGPKDFTNTFHEFDLRPGGLWRFDMHGPDGAQYAITKQFVEVSPPECIVFRHVQEAHGFEMTMTFADSNGKTLLTWRMLFDDAEDATAAREVIRASNEENFDRLAAELARDA